MLGKMNQEEMGRLLPEEWALKVEVLLTSLYAAKLAQNGKKFQVHGVSYSDELVIAVGYMDEEDTGATPITYCACVEMNEKSNTEEMLNALVDSIGIFFDSYFMNEEPDELFSPVWQEAKVKKLNFHYKISRENIGLTLEANRLLEGE
jgi:hypothetical protein